MFSLFPLLYCTFKENTVEEKIKKSLSYRSVDVYV